MIKIIKNWITSLGDALFFSQLGLVDDTKKGLCRNPLNILVGKRKLMQKAYKNGIENLLSWAEAKSENPSLARENGLISEYDVENYSRIAAHYGYESGSNLEDINKRIRNIRKTLYKNIIKKAEELSDRFTEETDKIILSLDKTNEEKRKAYEYHRLIGSHYFPILEIYEDKLKNLEDRDKEDTKNTSQRLIADTF